MNEQEIVTRRIGRTTWKGTCPFHEPEDVSLVVDEQTGAFECFECGATGEAVEPQGELRCWVLARRPA